MVGRELIEAAKIHKQVSQLTQISLAVNTFHSKYNGLPGDMHARAGELGLTPLGPMVGDDNGLINDQFGNLNIRTPDQEPVLFFAYLVEANMLPRTFVKGANCRVFDPGEPMAGEGRYYSMTLNSAMGMIPITYEGKTWMYMGISDCSSGDAVGIGIKGVMTPIQAFGIDAKLDNGVPSSGTILAFRGSYRSGLQGIDLVDNVPNECVIDAAGTFYNIQDSTNQCRLLVRLW